MTYAQQALLQIDAGGLLLLTPRATDPAGKTAARSTPGKQSLSGADMLAFLDNTPHGASSTLQTYRDLSRLSRLLIQRGGVRPGLSHDEKRLQWAARLDADERALLVDMARSAPPILWEEAPSHDARWTLLRSLLDALCDIRMRLRHYKSETSVHYPGSLEAAFESLLTHDQPKEPYTAVERRAVGVMPAWEREARLQEKPAVRLVLQLQPPAADGPFLLWFWAESRDGEIRVPVIDIFSGASRAHLLADDLAPLREQCTTTLRAVGRELPPVELALSGGRPDRAVLTPDQAWSLLSRLRRTLEPLGLRVDIPAELERLETRFPRARVRMTRTDNISPEQVSLAWRYEARWEVASQDRTMDADELRAAGQSAPLVRTSDGWMPMTAEAAQRLASITERPVGQWTGAQALAAALAGEVRQPGDLADATVLCEQGMTGLIAELAREPEIIPAPSGLEASLRHYQERGLSWLMHRTRLGLGALLADDMGLGKTIQLISLLLTLQEQQANDGPTLLSCPASLVGNWERELARFAPSLPVVRHHGQERLRDADELAQRAGPHAVVLTTYGLVRRDAPLLSQITWGMLACDEAQVLKNPQSALARTIKTIPARRRVALSGTPVENRLTELWSLMDLLNPGLLGPLDRFRRELALPIERDRDARATRWLQAATRPFLLRRLKSDPAIAPELPEKQIIRTVCTLTTEQARLYQEAVDRSLAVIDTDIGIARQGRILQLLTRLKQVCNHPAQGAEGPQELSGRSGKLERATEILEEVVAGGEKALVFTQYVAMGEMLSSHLGKKLGIEVPLFHGGLTLEAREAMVRRFQDRADGPPILVLSLKAGGVGLNLTRATHVMHYDRWWNPAVEDQATDRVHRIGQQQRVTVHQLVTMGTLEERIDRLLDEKRRLADAVVESGTEAWLGRLSTDELRALVALGSDAAVENVEAWGDATN